MSGTWIYRTGQVFIPLHFAAAGMDMSGNTIHPLRILTAPAGPGPLRENLRAISGKP